MFFRKKPAAPAYVEAGTQLTFKLVQSLSLVGWENGVPSYTLEEVAAIEKELSHFQQMANEQCGGEACFHPDAVSTVRRWAAGTALENLNEDWWWFARDTLPENWKERVSTYLKEWAARLNPSTLIHMSVLLARAGHKDKAREAVEAVLHFFPAYAPTYFAGGDSGTEATKSVIKEAQEALAVL
jgi:hypothetical protein